ncbi:hypothetical protein FACS1894120_1820 [Clostridia bacterium]|nr:hypothetical protein FACS1894120_1820 [Clostridia bacterium]
MRLCPIESANRTFVNEDNRLKVKIDRQKCVVCGRCVFACAHTARSFVDDSPTFFRRLKESDGKFAGSKLSVILHPSFNASFGKDSRQVLAWLKSRGVNRVFDASEGTAVFAWATQAAYAERVAECANSEDTDESKTVGFIVATCPAVVNYAQTHRPKMIDILSPVISPVMCQIVYLRAMGVTDDFAVLTPCIASAGEFSEITKQSAVSAGKPAGNTLNVTFKSIWEEVVNSGLRGTESDVNGSTDPVFSDMSAEEAVRIAFDYFARKGDEEIPSAEIDIVSDSGVFDICDEYVAACAAGTAASEYGVNLSGTRLLPVLFPLSCRDSCTRGPAGLRGGRYKFTSLSSEDSERTRSFQKQRDMRMRDKFADLSRQFSPRQFQRSYEFIGGLEEEIPRENIEAAFARLEKNDFINQNFNCGACGCETCYEMAKKIAQGLGAPESCVHKLRRDSENERKRNEKCVKFIEKISHMLCGVGGTENFSTDSHMGEALDAVISVFDASAVSFWEAVPDNRKHDVYNVRQLQKRMLPKYETRDDKIKALSRHMRKAEPPPPEWWVTSLFRSSYILCGDEEYFPYRGILGDDLKTMLSVPIRLRDESFGFLILGYDVRHRFTPAEISTITSIGALLLSSVMAEKLERSACLDELTGIYNRRAFTDMVTALLERNRRECPDKVSTMMMLDLDFFKKVNDTFGHQTGDAVLRAVSDTVRSQLRPYDIFARYGGEEFCVFFDKTTESDAYKVSERIRRRIEDLEIIYDDNTINPTVSIGLSQLKTSVQSSSDALKTMFKLSDEALYKAKESGRNQVFLYSVMNSSQNLGLF